MESRYWVHVQSGIWHDPSLRIEVDSSEGLWASSVWWHLLHCTFEKYIVFYLREMVI